MSEKYILMKRYWWCPILVILVISCCWYCCWDSVGTVLLVRHAEKANVAGGDPPLSQTGEIRAQALLHVVKESGVAAVFTTQYQRTQQTVQPVIDQLGLPVTQYTATDVEGLTDIIRSNWSGQTVLVACHSNTMTLIIEQLGGDPIGIIPEGIYDELYVVTRYRCRSPQVLHLKYGAPS